MSKSDFLGGGRLGPATKSPIVPLSKRQAFLTPKNKKPIAPEKNSVAPLPKKRKLLSKERTEQAKNELLYYGRRICHKIAAVRREDIIRVYCTEETLPALGPVLQWCSQQRKAYHVVSNEELERITQSVHHEGVAILALVEPSGSSEDLLAFVDGETAPLLILDGVQNPHNLGTIMRVMASFGWPALVGSSELPTLSASAARMSEGGSAYVRSFACDDLATTLRALKKRGYRIVGTSSRAQTSLYAQPLPKKCAFVLGSEVSGMSDMIRKLIDEERIIPTTGQVDSLNVSVASGLLLGEHMRLHGLGPGRSLS